MDYDDFANQEALVDDLHLTYSSLRDLTCDLKRLGVIQAKLEEVLPDIISEGIDQEIRDYEYLSQGAWTPEPEDTYAIEDYANILPQHYRQAGLMAACSTLEKRIVALCDEDFAKKAINPPLSKSHGIWLVKYWLESLKHINFSEDFGDCWISVQICQKLRNHYAHGGPPYRELVSLVEDCTLFQTHIRPFSNESPVLEETFFPLCIEEMEEFSYRVAEVLRLSCYTK